LPQTRPRSYELTPSLVAAYAGGPVVCLSPVAVGRRYRLRAARPGAESNRQVYRRPGGLRGDLPSGANHTIGPVAPAPPGLIRVDISGPLEQRAGYHDECGGWSDGYDAIADRLCAAFEVADVLLVVDSPGGACAGLQQGVARALAAKVAKGRRVTVWADELIGSAAVWVSMVLGDELFIPVAGQIGSIGARGAHASIAGALEKEGVAFTYFADPPEKVALAPERPLDEVGLARGMRDVKIAADAFRAAVCASPIGVRHGLTPEGLYALGADVLTGQAAVDAGLADGVATFEEVVEYALKQAGREEAALRETG